MWMIILGRLWTVQDAWIIRPCSCATHMYTSLQPVASYIVVAWGALKCSVCTRRYPKILPVVE